MESDSPDVKRVLAANQAFYDAFNSKDVEAMRRAWSRRDDLICIHPGWNVLQGRQPVLDSWRAILTNPDQARILVRGAGVTMLGDVAVVICRELVAGSPLASTNLFVKEDNDWRLLHHQSGPVAMQAT
jgi:ketosteroid isomerase-like protein